jgi:hypothetical protein
MIDFPPLSRGQLKAGDDSASEANESADSDPESATCDAATVIRDRRSDAETGSQPGSHADEHIAHAVALFLQGNAMDVRPWEGVRCR